MIPFIDLREEYRTIEPEVSESLREVFSRGSFILGESVNRFETEFAQFCGVRFAVGVGSGTEALHLSLLAAGVKPGEEVITVSNTAAATALAICAANARPVFVDVHPATYTIDIEKIEAAITSKTKAIIPVHLYGHPAAMDAITRIANQHQFVVIEDVAQACGAEYNGVKAGSIGQLGCFSFYPTKNLGAYGDGGMVVTNDAELFERLRLLRNLGQTDRYHHEICGLNSRLDEIQAAILQVKLKHLNQWNERRRTLAEAYSRAFEGLNLILPIEAHFAKHVYHLYVIRTERRDQLKEYLTERGIQTLIHYPVPLHRQNAFKGLADNTAVPVTEKLSGQILSLPLYPQLTDEMQNRVIDAIHDFSKAGFVS